MGANNFFSRRTGILKVEELTAACTARNFHGIPVFDLSNCTHCLYRSGKSCLLIATENKLRRSEFEITSRDASG